MLNPWALTRMLIPSVNTKHQIEDDGGQDLKIEWEMAGPRATGFADCFADCFHLRMFYYVLAQAVVKVKLLWLVWLVWLWDASPWEVPAGRSLKASCANRGERESLSNVGSSTGSLVGSLQAGLLFAERLDICSPDTLGLHWYPTGAIWGAEWKVAVVVCMRGVGSVEVCRCGGVQVCGMQVCGVWCGSVGMAGRQYGSMALMMLHGIAMDGSFLQQSRGMLCTDPPVPTPSTDPQYRPPVPTPSPDPPVLTPQRHPCPPSRSPHPPGAGSLISF
ncbi:hypothetical protein E6O75_ATG08287 [Venturia nashicola]|uniref:Uncharacterized protein n=1 Tax=Venturia nashicola TaxID=86259 RepID=A0A4Z1P8I3_9PEZI|nr:hypothetical protein E6O75_ATG08287 [Venturia nashicola]